MTEKFVSFKNGTEQILNNLITKENYENAEMLNETFMMTADGLQCVTCNEAEKEHELTIHLQMPIINDGIRYTGKMTGGRKEYQILDGTDYARVKIKKKDGRGWRK